MVILNRYINKMTLFMISNRVDSNLNKILFIYEYVAMVININNV